jgi:hypothetical protein
VQLPLLDPAPDQLAGLRAVLAGDVGTVEQLTLGQRPVVGSLEQVEQGALDCGGIGGDSAAGHALP